MGCIRPAVVLCLTILGLQTTAAPEAAATNAVDSIKEVSFVGADLDKTVLAVVDGKPLTAAEVRDAVYIISRVKALSSGRKYVAPSGRRANSIAMHLTPQLISTMVLEKELDRRGLTASESSDAEILARYNKRFKSDAKTPDELCALFGEQAPVFKRQFARESRYCEMFSREPDLKVTEADVAKFYKDISNRVYRCSQINARATNRMEQAWKELSSGRPWDAVATNYTEDALLDASLAENWKDWISLDLKKIEPMELMIAVSKMKPGEYTRPMEVEDGLVIVKLTERVGDFCSLARILSRLAVEVSVPGRAEAETKIRKRKETEFQKRTLQKLRDAADLQYPFGKKFIFKIWDEPVRKKPVKKAKGKGR